MRAAPPIQVTLRDVRLWRGALLLTTGLDAAALVAWWITHRSADAPAVFGLAALALGVGAVGLARSMWRRPPAALCWDGRGWHAGDDFESMTPGEVDIAIDLDRWLLLRFVASAPGAGRGRTHWLPVDRRGLEPRWHALRCALYSPRPRPVVDPAQELVAGPDAP